MAFLLNRSGRQMIRLSSWAAKPTTPLIRVLTSVNNNCFSTDSSSSGGMIQESNPKDVVIGAAIKDLIFSCGEYYAMYMVNVVQNKPLPSKADVHKFLDDQLKKLPPLDDEASETDVAEKNLKAFTPEMIKAVSVFADTVTAGLLNYLPKPAFKVKGDNFNFTLDANGLYLTVNVSGLAKEHLVVLVVKDHVVVTGTNGVAPDLKVFEAIWLPDNHSYDADEVTGTIMEDGVLKICFPVSKEGGEPKEKYFEVNLV